MSDGGINDFCKKHSHDRKWKNIERKSLLPDVHAHGGGYRGASPETFLCKKRTEVSSLLRVAGRGLYHAVRSRGVTGWYSGIVKKKRAAEVPAVPARAEDAPEQDPDVIIEQARKAIEAERGKKPEGCVICGEEIAPTSSEGLGGG